MGIFRQCLLGFGLVASLNSLSAVELVRKQGGHIYPVSIDTAEEFLNEWPVEEEARF